MSELSAVEVIAGVIGNHRYSLMDVPVHRCVCGVDVGRDDGAMDDHRATEVDKALGGLTREHDHTVLIDGAGRAVRLDNVARWIGGWTPEEAS